MITRRTKIQLLVFAVITLVGVSFVGARYAQLDRVLLDRSYTVVAHYPESGGIFVGGEVTYRGVGIGKVTELELTDDGVDVHLEIENAWDEIPADSRALVGNRSAVGEQYVELQPHTDDGPYLEDGDRITDVATPIATEKLLGDIATTVDSVDREALRTTIHELGEAFGGTGEDLQQIIDTGNSFIETADANFELTTALIRDANVVLRGQRDSESSLRMFADRLSSFSTALVGADRHLRKVIDSGSFTANQLRTFLEQNEAPLAELLNNVITTGRVVVKNIPGIRTLLIAYPIVLEGAFGVIAKSPGTNLYDTHIGLILTTTPPCYAGYEGTVTRGPNDREDRLFNLDAQCTEPPTKSNPRGFQNLPRVTPDLDGVPDAGEEVLASFDPETGELDWDATGPARSTTPAPSSAGSPDGSQAGLPVGGNVAPPSLGEDSWKWLYLEPLLDAQG
ncbi:MlaD family protein [Nocardioides sp. TF02-7]|uniref:MCE family protein n=1 Tax=Nocardioides sp. TF02-7 TaxID=2917724 RepID=UPI001F070BB1|nr:MlaD family protein [Nocardioides sp. TF02-7]UMG93779.1 MCE family protein [Nocardioides sp. TF02-7]